MMGQLPVLVTRKAVNKSRQRLAIKRTNQHAARFLRGHQLRQRHHVEIRNTPDFLLQLFDIAHLRDLIDITYADVGNHFTSIGNAMYDACRPARNTFCVAALKSDSCARKMLGTKVCGLRSMTGNHVLCTWTMMRWPFLKV